MLDFIPEKVKSYVMLGLALLIAVLTIVVDQLGVDAPRWLIIVLGALGSVAATLKSGWEDLVKKKKEDKPSE